MKLAISGKGGVGKTTLTAVLAKLFASQGKHVIAIDADPAMNLASALGLRDLGGLTPIAQMKELIEERTGVKGQSYGAFFKMNPRVTDLPDTLSIEKDGIRLMVLGGVFKGGGGCACPENVLLKTLLGHLMLQRQEVVIADMAAGIEHLGRATVQGIDAMLVVVEPGLRSVETGRQVVRLARDIGLARLFIVGNKMQSDAHKRFVRDAFPDVPVLGFVSYDERILQADFECQAAYEDNDKLLAECQHILSGLQARLKRPDEDD